MAERTSPELKALKARVRALERELTVKDQRVAELTELRGQSGVIGEDFINRTSLAHLRTNTWVGFVETVRGLPESRLMMGYAECRATTVGSLLADLRTLGLSPPRTTEEAKRRLLCARMLESSAFFWVLSKPGSIWCERCWVKMEPRTRYPACTDKRGHRACPIGYDHLRVRFIAEVAEVYYQHSVWTLFVRSPETLMMPGFGQQSSSGSISEEDGD